MGRKPIKLNNDLFKKPTLSNPLNLSHLIPLGILMPHPARLGVESAPSFDEEAAGLSKFWLELPGHKMQAARTQKKAARTPKKSYAFLRVLTRIFGFLSRILGFLTHSCAAIFCRRLQIIGLRSTMGTTNCFCNHSAMGTYHCLFAGEFPSLCAPLNSYTGKL